MLKPRSLSVRICRGKRWSERRNRRREGIFELECTLVHSAPVFATTELDLPRCRQSCPRSSCEVPPRNWEGGNLRDSAHPASNIPTAQRSSINTESSRSCAVRELFSGFLRFDCCDRIQNRVCGCRPIACSQKLLVVMMLG